MNKKEFLIELFMDECKNTVAISNRRPSKEPARGFYVRIKIRDENAEEFYGDVVNEEDLFYEEQAFLGIIEKVEETNKKFFICFASLKFELTENEFEKLKQTIDAKNEMLIKAKNEMIEQRDNNWLELAFAQKNEKEKRKVLLEKK